MRKAAARSRRFTAGSSSIIVLGCALALSLIGLTGYEIVRQYHGALAGARHDLNLISEITAGEIRRTIHSVAQVVQQTAEAASDPEQARIKPPSSRAFRDDMRDRATGVPQLFGLAVLDARGQVVNTLHDPRDGDHLTMLRHVLAFHRDNPTLGLHFSVLTHAPLGGSPIIPISRRLTDGNGDFAGVVFAAIAADQIHEMLRDASALPGSGVVLSLIDGPVLAAFPSSVGDLADPGAAGLSSTAVQELADRQILHRQLHPYPLRLSVQVDTHTVLEPWRRHALRMGFGAVLAIGLLFLSLAILLRANRRDTLRVTQLHEQDQMLRLSQVALDNFTDMVIWHDAQGRIVHVNQAAVTRLGYGRDDLLGRSVAEIHPKFSHDDWHQMLVELHRSGHWRFESELRDSSGQTIPVEVLISPYSQDGHLFCCALCRDIIDRKRTERVLLERTARLEASNAELEQFAYVASHDLREPLRTVNSFVTMLARRYDDRLDDEAREYIAFAQEGALRMDRLIQDLLEYSRVGRIERTMVPIDMAQPLDLAVKSLAPAIADNQARVDIPADLPSVIGNEAELVRLFVNLIGNALKYRHPDRPPVIEIGATLHGGVVTATIADNGIGIAPEYFERVFRVFQRLHGQDKYEGTGIGLAICKKIVEHHGGRIWLSSVPDQGTTVFLTLPLAPAY